MSEDINPLAINDLYEAISPPKQQETPAVKNAIVVDSSSEGVFVSIPGGAEKTPVTAQGVQVSTGDNVSVIIADGECVLIANNTDPAAGVIHLAENVVNNRYLQQTINNTVLNCNSGDFLNVTNSISDLKEQIKGKQDAISDIDTIRKNASDALSKVNTVKTRLNGSWGTLFGYRSVVKDNISVGATSYASAEIAATAVNNYTPRFIGGYNIANASSSGGNCTNCFLYKSYISGNNATVSIGNFGSKIARVKVTVYIVYVNNAGW